MIKAVPAVVEKLNEPKTFGSKASAYGDRIRKGA